MLARTIHDKPCPRCKSPLIAAQGADEAELACQACHGLFLSARTTAQLTPERAAEVSEQLVKPDEAIAVAPEASVTYLPCPVCKNRMNRLNFAHRSGIIVDVCRQHGTWFDGGELSRAIAFVRSDRYQAAQRRTHEAAEEKKKQERLAALVAEARSDAEREGAWSSGRVQRGATIADIVLDLLF